MKISNNPCLIVALDFADLKSANDLVERLDPTRCRLKVGKEMFTRFGPSFITSIVKKGFDVFLDLKFHDIPNQVAGACLAAADLGVWMLNVHALGGMKMLEAAKNAIASVPGKRPLLIAVTLLTSLDESELKAIGLKPSVKENVLNLALLANNAGLDGVVCSAEEAAYLRAEIGENFLLVTPGIRLAQDNRDDQKRIMTPRDAIASGVDYLVIGRPITKSPDPLAVIADIEKMILR